MILERIEPVAKQTDDSAVLEALGNDDDSELPARDGTKVTLTGLR